MPEPSITINKVTRRNGVAGTYAYDLLVTYGYDDAPPECVSVTFVSSVYGAPVVATTDGFTHHLVNDWRQYGERLDNQWIRRFYDKESIIVDDPKAPRGIVYVGNRKPL